MQVMMAQEDNTILHVSMQRPPKDSYCYVDLYMCI